jgi:hypothetical protein
MPCRAVFRAVSLWFAMSTVGASGDPHLSMPMAYIERRMRRTMWDSRSFDSFPSACAFLSGTVKDSCSQSFMSLCTPESWSSPFSAKSQLAVAPQSDITPLGSLKTYSSRRILCCTTPPFYFDPSVAVLLAA